MVLYYSHSIKPVPVAGREAHIHLCLVSVVRSSTSGPLVASDTDSSPAPSPQPMSLQFVAVGIRRPRCQSYVVFQSVKEPLLSFHVEGAGFEPTLSYVLAILPLVVCLAVLPQGHCIFISLSRPSMMSLLILCFGYDHDRDSFTVPSSNTILTFSRGSNSPCLRSHSGVNILNCLHMSSGDSHTSSAPSITSATVCLTVAIISALSILSIVLAFTVPCGFAARSLSTHFTLL